MVDYASLEKLRFDDKPSTVCKQYLNIWKDNQSKG